MDDKKNSLRDINDKIEELQIERKKLRDKRDSYEMEKRGEIASLYDALDTVKSPEERAIYQSVIERFEDRMKYVCNDFDEREYQIRKEELDLEMELIPDESETEEEQKGEEQQDEEKER